MKKMTLKVKEILIMESQEHINQEIGGEGMTEEEEGVEEEEWFLKGCQECFQFLVSQETFEHLLFLDSRDFCPSNPFIFLLDSIMECCLAVSRQCFVGHVVFSHVGFRFRFVASIQLC